MAPTRQGRNRAQPSSRAMTTPASSAPGPGVRHPAPGVSPEAITDQMLHRFDNCEDPRLRELMQSLVQHLHAFAVENRLTEEEWAAGIAFLTATGQACTAARQEFILLSDTLGLSMVVDAINHPVVDGSTESTVLGPFYVPESPWREMGDSIAGRPEDGEPAVVSGRVLDTAGQPIGGAVLDVWQNAATGLYAVQDDTQPPTNLRGRFKTGADGRFRFRTVLPTDYQIPTDGPVGQMLAATGRLPWRPAHLHIRVEAPGCRPLTTHLFDGASPWLASDAVLGVKPSLVCTFTKGPEGYRLERDLVLGAS